MSDSGSSDSQSVFDDDDTFLDQGTIICDGSGMTASRFFSPSAPAVLVQFGAASHPGKVRDNNEDHYVVVRRRRLRDVLLTNLPSKAIPSAEECAYAMVVADGMGGAAFGELASSLVLRIGMDLGLQEIKWTVKVTEKEIGELKEKLSHIVDQIDRSLFEHAEWNSELSGMGSTLTGVYTVGNEALIIHVGDSRAYLYRDRRLECLTRDHTAARKLIDAGLIDPGSEGARKLSYLLTNCLGGAHRGAEPDITHMQLADGDQLLLCTDGLTDVVTDAEIGRCLETSRDPGAACQALINLALEHGGPDNVTVIIGRYEVPMG